MAEECRSVDFLANLPLELAEKILQHLMVGKSAERFLGQCCLVSKAWNDRINISNVWVILDRKRGFQIQRHTADDTDKFTHKQMYSRCQTQMDQLQVNMVDTKMPYREGMLEMNYDETEAAVRAEYPDFNLVDYTDGIVTLGNIHIVFLKSYLSNVFM